MPVRLAKLMGTLNELVEDPKTKDSVFPLPNMTLIQWHLIEPQLERVYGITHDEINAVQLRKEIIAEYVKLDAKSLIELIHALDYADIPLLLEMACDVVKKSALGRFNFEQIDSLPEDMGNRIILDKILASCGPMPARELGVGRGHEGGVTSVCVTEDGKIVSGSNDNTVRVWDMQGKELAICRGHEALVRSVCVTQDGKILSGSGDHTVRVWDMQGNQLAVCRGHQRSVCSVCVTKDDKIVSGSFDDTVRVWDMQGKELAICRGHEGSVRSVCVTRNGSIVSGSADCTVRVWNMQGKEVAICRGHEDSVSSVCIRYDGKIVSRSPDKTVRVWDVGLLGRIECMDQNKARVLWELLHNISQKAKIGKQELWKEIERILGEDTPISQAKINNNNNE